MSGFNLNKVILIGNIGKDAEVRTLNDNLKKAQFPLATNESYQKDGKWNTITEWHNIVLWRNLAERADRLKKGMYVYVEGKIKTRTYDDKDGQKKYITEIHADVCRLLEKTGDCVVVKEDVAAESATEMDDGFNTAGIVGNVEDIHKPTDDLPF